MKSSSGLGIQHCRSSRLVAALVVLLAIALPLHATPVHAQTATVEAPDVPDPYKLNMLIRTTLIALNQANRTGNYTVLRDLAAPAFARTNDAARLAEIFAKLRKRDLDLSPILFFQPKLQGPARFTDNGLLRLTGYFETKPEQISFDMLFQPASGDWLLFGLAVEVAPPPAEEQPTVSTPEPAPDKRSSVEPGVKQDSAPLPLKAQVPAPARRPSTPKPDATADAAPETEVGEDASGSTWSLWRN